jgi:hypothetical protein
MEWAPRVLEKRAEALASTFNKEEMANTLWARAKIGLQLGAAVMRVLEERADAPAGTLKAHEVVNTLYDGNQIVAGGSSKGKECCEKVKTPTTLLPAEAGIYQLKCWEVVEFVETMRSDASLAMTLRLKR